jgi:outer membrane receptor protein involved in Fe transport
VVGRALVLLATVSMITRAWPGAAADPSTTLETVEVTGPRVEAEARQAPASITLLPSEEIESAGVETTVDLGTRVPNLRVTEGGDRRNNIFSIRGLGNTPIAGTSVGVYVDGIPIVDVRAPLIPLFDVQDAEVLRGTQNLRFGRSADGGAINLITRTPGSVLSSHASVQYGDFNTQIYEGSVGGPLGSDRVRSASPAWNRVATATSRTRFCTSRSTTGICSPAAASSSCSRPTTCRSRSSARHSTQTRAPSRGR